MKHYTKEELEQYRNKDMAVFSRIKCAAHLKECPSCASLLAELEEDAAFVGRLRESIKRYEEATKEETSKEEVEDSLAEKA